MGNQRIHKHNQHSSPEKGSEHSFSQKSTAQLRSFTPPASGINFTIQKKENKTGLPDNLKSGIENLSGMDISDVKVHYNSAQPAQLNAHAYAQGNLIHVAPGQEKHLPHEAWHVVQQKQGRVKPTKQLKSAIAINDDVHLEKEADVMGAKALQAAPHEKQQLSTTPTQKKGSTEQEVLQGVFIYSFLGDNIMETPESAAYYTKIGFHKVEANGLAAWSDPRNVDRARFFLKVMSYRELSEEMPAASSMSRPPLGGHDAAGIQGIVQNIITKYPPGKFIYLSPGASGDAIVMALNQMAHVPVYRLALSNIQNSDLATLKKDDGAFRLLETYMYKSIGGLLKADHPVVIIDAVDTGASLLTLVEMIRMIDTKNKKKRDVEMMSLNVTKEGLKDKGVHEIEGHTENENFVKYRIYWQQYKSKFPRIFEKVPISTILSGAVTDPPAPNVEALAIQSEEISAMIMGLHRGQYTVTENENTIRILMSQMGKSREEARELVEDKEPAGAKDGDDSFDDDFV